MFQADSSAPGPQGRSLEPLTELQHSTLQAASAKEGRWQGCRAWAAPSEPGKTELCLGWVSWGG